MRVQSALQAQVSECLVPSSELLLSQLPPFNSWSELAVQTLITRRKRVQSQLQRAAYPVIKSGSKIVELLVSR